ncbi:hypothetical protein DPMN_126356 [Dreissena polymorpha]|uniref:Uncharacterized protein n=1 Tax=Dreissena polymorpha TaxID=45954 RepID=A0A9D4GZZ5_DREPO|nr:hypothetical protein DPMN_126356 [Dreissena polymorpha]
MKKTINAAPIRLQRMMLHVQGYDMTLEHKAGTQIPLADTLSRHYMSDTYPELSEATNVHVHMVIATFP